MFSLSSGREAASSFCRAAGSTGKWTSFEPRPGIDTSTASDETFAFYKDKLSGGGWKISVASTAGAGSFQIVANKGGREAVVGSSPANEGANLTVVVE